VQPQYTPPLPWPLQIIERLQVIFYDLYGQIFSLFEFCIIALDMKKA
jgi:hypothetical protein